MTTESEANAIPIIDIAPFLHGDDRGVAEVVAAVRRACEEIGFFVVTEHGVPDPEIDRIYTLSRAFFDLPAAEKSRVGESGPVMGGLMHFPLEGESLAATREDRTPESVGAAHAGDLKESLDYGPGFRGDAWPTCPEGLQAAWQSYFAVMSDLAKGIRRIFAAAIGLPDTFFDDKFDRHLSSLRVLNYPDQTGPPQPGQIRAGAHSDYGVLTILRSEAAPGGLQVQDRTGRWIDAPALPGGFVINIGDAMMRWTNDHWISTVHRVVNPPADARGSARRQSIAFFNNPNRDTVIDCLGAFCGPGNPAKYPPISYGDYAEICYRRAHGADKTLGLGGVHDGETREHPSPGD